MMPLVRIPQPVRREVKMTLEQLLQTVPRARLRGDGRVEVRRIVLDSRHVRPGDLFAGVPGGTVDGRRYFREALERGAAALLAPSGSRLPEGVPAITAPEVRPAVGLLAAALNGFPSRDLALIGITGTNGKTTTAYMIREVVRHVHRRMGMLGTVQYEIGDRCIPAGRTTPEAPDIQSMLREMIRAGCDSAVLEVSSHALHQHRTTGTDFDVAVFTNLSRDHLDYHPTMEDYFEAKSFLFTALGRGEKPGVAVINADDPWGARLLTHPDLRAETLTYGTVASAMIRAGEILLNGVRSDFQVETPWGAAAVRLPMPGYFNISNALAAIAACGQLGIAPHEAAAALARMRAVPGRVEPIAGAVGFRVLVDYAHTPDALHHVLQMLKPTCEGRLTVVFGCGGDRDREKRAMMGSVAGGSADRVVITSDNPRSEPPDAICRDIQSGLPPHTDAVVELDRARAIERAIEEAGPGDLVLIAGKGHETVQECADTIIPFDDREIAAAALARRPDAPSAEDP